MTIRASRYEAAATGPKRRTFTGKQRDALRFIVEYRFLLTSQLAQLMGMTTNALTKHTRILKDNGYVRVVAVDRADLDPTLPNDVTRIRGSVEDLLLPTKAGVTCLIENDYISVEASGRAVPDFGYSHSMRLAHDSMAHQLRVWLECSTLNLPGSRIVEWHEGRDECRFVVPGGTDVIPDAWFVFDPGVSGQIVGMVEADRGTMTNPEQWEQKVWRYMDLFASPVMKERTGIKKGRVFTLTPPIRDKYDRVSVINRIVSKVLAGDSNWHDRFVAVPWTDLKDHQITDSFWRLPNNQRVCFGP